MNLYIFYPLGLSQVLIYLYEASYLKLCIAKWSSI